MWQTYPSRVSLALEGAAQVVDDDAGTAGAEESGIRLPETAAGAGDDDDLAVEPQILRHGDVYVCGGGGAEGERLDAQKVGAGNMASFG